MKSVVLIKNNISQIIIANNKAVPSMKLIFYIFIIIEKSPHSVKGMWNGRPHKTTPILGRRIPVHNLAAILPAGATEAGAFTGAATAVEPWA